MPVPSPALLDLIAQVVAGQASVDDLMREINRTRNENLAADSQSKLPSGGGEDGPERAEAVCRVEGATVDLGRKDRCGFGEVIYGEGKSAELLERIVTAQLGAGQSALVTRIDSDVAQRVKRTFPFAFHNSVGRTLRVSSGAVGSPDHLSADQAKTTLHAAVVTAGSTDAPIAEEAIETLAWMGVPIQRFDDIGVAGPQRLLAAVPRLRLASAVVVVAGMEGALPSVVAGHLASPIFAVPTSVGYGACLGGLTPLLGMLSACAASVAVVNIDAGFKGGYLAGMVVRQLQQLISERNR